MTRIGAAILLFAWAIPPAAHAENGDAPAFGAHGMVATAEGHATDVGVAILEQGGNAFDAAAAVGFALAVTYPTAGNIGGGGFCVGLKADGSTFALDFREEAPGAAHRDMYLDAEGNVIPRMSSRGPLSAGVPGSTAGLLLLAKKHGTMTRKRILAPAIDLAERGYVLPRNPSSRLKANPAAAKIYFPEGREYVAGELLKQPDLARTLRLISKKGRRGFYKGAVADLIVAEMERSGGLITHNDLKAYRPKQREPFVFKNGGYELITMSLPSSGGVTNAQILGLVGLPALKAAGHNSARYISMLAEAERLAFSDRNYFLGDPDFSDVPVERLTSKAYLAERRKLMPPAGRAGVSKGVSHGEVESEETTHFTVADQWGNVVAITYTLNFGYGSGIVVGGAGFLLNNEMDNFSAKPGEPNSYGMVGADANSIAPRKRMLSSMTPTIVRKDGEFAFTIGTPGGPTIITSVLQMYLNIVLFDMNIKEAIDAPRVHHQWLPDTIQPERGTLSAEATKQLEDMGYTISERRSIGMAAGIARANAGGYYGHADRRGYGRAGGH